MIVVQDRIEVAASDLERLNALFQERYMSGAAARGLEFVESLISPPVKLRDVPSTVWLRWRVSDPGAWWAMRAQSGNPEVAAFWAEVDSFCLSRERTYCTSDVAVDLPQPADISGLLVTARAYRETAQLALRKDLAGEDRDRFAELLRRAEQELPGVELTCLGANLAPEYAAGDYTWDLLFPDQATAEAARASDFWQRDIEPVLSRYCDEVHAVALQTLGAGLRSPGLAGGIKRTGYFRLLPDTPSDVAKRFENDLLEMPAQIPEILNWRLSRAQTLPWSVVDCAPWTYVWEQEFESIEGLTGPYMIHPHHWAHIDRWFDPESGIQAVDTQLSHAFSEFGESVLTRETQR